jgi:predicted ATPase/transcriptional regulator with XRE-family HTH domain
MDHRPSFAYLLKRHRLAAGLTHERLAERATLSARSISDLERGVSQHPRRETVDLLSRALQLSPSNRAAFEEAARSASLGPIDGPEPAHGPGRIPLHLTSFIGRDEVGQIHALVRRDGVRLLTLTGPGGTGKSRLAIEVAEAIGRELPGHIRFVELAPVAAAEDVPRAIGRALGITNPEGSDVLPAIAERIGVRELLLVLDNFEHVLPAAPFVVELLRACPRLTALVTSRASLQVSGERDLHIPPLPVPEPGRSLSEEQIGRYAAVQLFLDRAAQVRPSFALSAENATTVTAICARLDGLPLALELAAARLKLLTPQALLHRLDGVTSGSALHVLTRGSQDAPPHQRTLRDTMLWSYDLLSAVEQRVFRRMAIFSGGCTLEAAEAVVGNASWEIDHGDNQDASPPPGTQPPSPNILDVIGSLLDKSLLYVDEGPDAEPRFMMLETVREFGLEQLRASGELEAVARAHGRHYLAMVESIGPLLFASPEKLRRAVPEHHNAQEALRWLFHHG